MGRFVEKNPDIGPKPHYELVALIPHSAGVFAASEVSVSGENRQQLLNEAWMKCTGSRYVSRLVDPITNETVWQEACGWSEDQPQD